MIVRVPKSSLVGHFIRTYNIVHTHYGITMSDLMRAKRYLRKLYHVESYIVNIIDENTTRFITFG